jgi:hypothetical protein
MVRSARNVQVSDRYDPSSFEILDFQNDDGTIAASTDEILPGEKFEFNVTVVPKLFGIYESTRARMRYTSGEAPEGEEEEESFVVTKNGYSSSIGRVRILSTDEHMKQQIASYSKWASLVAVVVIPMALVYWYFFKQQTVAPKVSSRNNKKRN